MKTEKQIQASRDASRKWRQSNPDKVKAQKARHYALHSEKIRAKFNPANRARGQALRREVIAFLGSCCQTCGFEDWRALQVDHVQGAGRKDRSQFKNTQQFLHAVIADTTGKYQLLCSNCNWIKRYEKHEHRWKPTPLLD